MSSTPVLKKIVAAIRQYDKIVLAGHINPDCDAISATYGLALAIACAFPKKVVKVVGKPTYWQNRYPFLKLKKRFFVTSDSVFGKKPYLAIAADTAISHRIYGYEPFFVNASCKVTVDHHPGKPNVFFDLAWCDSGYAASALQAIEIAAQILPIFPEDVAFHLVIGVYTDTGFFRHSLAAARPHVLAARCLKTVTDKTFAQFVYQLRERNSDYFAITRLLYSRVKLRNDLLFAVLRKKDVRKWQHNITQRVNSLGDTKNVRKWALCSPDPRCFRRGYRVHIRSNKVNLIPLANRFQGGGHLKAVGCRASNKRKLRKLLQELAQL